MSAAARKDPAAVETEVREKIHLEILKRTGAYHANDHILLPSGQHTTEYIEKTLVTTEPSFTEGLGAVIAKHFAQWPIDMVLSTGPGALILSHCVRARIRRARSWSTARRDSPAASGASPCPSSSSGSSDPA